MIDTNVIGLAFMVMSPVYVYLHKMNGNLESVTDAVRQCPYCNRTKEIKEMNDNE